MRKKESSALESEEEEKLRVPGGVEDVGEERYSSNAQLVHAELVPSEASSKVLWGQVRMGITLSVLEM